MNEADAAPESTKTSLLQSIRPFEESESIVDHSASRYYDNLPNRWLNAPPAIRKTKIDYHLWLLTACLLPWFAFGNSSCVPVLLLLTIFAFQFLHVLRKDTLIEFRRSGLTIHPRDFLGLQVGPSPLIEWMAISYVSASFKTVTYASSKSYAVKTLNLSVQQDAIDKKTRRWLYWYTRPILSLLLPGFWTGQLPGELVIKLDRDYFTREDDPLMAMSAIRAFMDPVKIDPSVEEWTGLGPNAISVTSLWLDKLSQITYQPGELPAGTTAGKGRYQVMDCIGSGGHSVTYRAKALQNGAGQTCSEVVLKEFILPVGGGTAITKRAIANIQKESELIRTLDHPQIVRCIDTFFEGKRAYLVLNYIEGKTLQRIVESQGKLQEEECIRLAIQMCDILDYLHTRTPPVVHRDFTPDNLMLRTDGKLELIDFNVAKQLESTSATQTVVGKHAYIPPEQFRGHATTQSDIYALGCTMFYLLAGEDPEPISVSHPKALVPELSDEIDALIAKATSQEASERFQDAKEMRSELERMGALKCSANP